MAALAPGQMLGGTVYRVVRELGAGGMGVVYEVEHVRLQKRYVAKVIHDQVRGDEGVQKRMDREAHLLANINHPNIVQVHDVGTTSDGTSYFVMEKLDGVDLRAAMKRGGVSRVRALQITVDILDALDHVHQRGIIHRDIKPENVFLARQPHGTATKVLDFGIAHVFDGDGQMARDRITKTGGFVGTLFYSAPEQMEGKPAAPPNDIYATGIMLFELLAGRGPFDDEPGIVSRCLKPAPRIDASMPKIGTVLADIIADALELKPERRPTAVAFAARLRDVLAGETTTPADDDIDDLLQNIPLNSVRGSPGVILETAAPHTPLMAGAPGPTSYPATLMSAAPTPTAPMPVSKSSTLRVYGTVQSVSAPQADTAPGLAQTVDPMSARKRSVFDLVSTAIAAVVVIGLVAGGATFLIKRGSAATKPTVAVAVAVQPPPPPLPAPAVVVPPPSASAPVASTTVTAKPVPKPSSAGRAKKDGYATVDDL